MGNDYRLAGVENSELLAGLSALVQRGNEITGGVLAHLAELEQRMLPLELGFSSLFGYCVEALGMSEAAAGRRVSAARVCRRFPEAFELVALGDLHLSALCELSPHLKPENASELFLACRRKTRREIEAVLAARFPKADVREQIRRLPARTQVPSGLREAQPSEPRENWGGAAAQPSARDPQHEAASADATGEDAASSDATSSDATRVEGAGIGSNREPAGVLSAQEGSRGGASVPRRREIEALSVDRFGVHFTADAELSDLIERARALASHRLPKGDLAGLMKLALTSFVQHAEKRRFALGAKPRNAATASQAEAAKPRNAASANTPSTPAAEAATEAAKSRNAASATAPSTPAITAEAEARPMSRRATPPGGAPLVADAASELRCQDVRSARTRGATKKRSRHVSAGARREVHARDAGQCSFVSEGGRRCKARAFLEIDHIEPWAALGATRPDNLRLRCRAHNQLHARNCFGAEHMAAKVATRIAARAAISAEPR
jgi:type IV secretory pathway VirB10-like protein